MHFSWPGKKQDTRYPSWPAAMENVRKRLQKTMPAALRKYYKRSRHLILTRYHKLKGERKKVCDLMLMYNDDLRLTHFLKEKYNNKIKVLKRISYGIRNFERFRTRILFTTTWLKTTGTWWSVCHAQKQSLQTKAWKYHQIHSWSGIPRIPPQHLF